MSLRGLLLGDFAGITGLLIRDMGGAASRAALAGVPGEATTRAQLVLESIPGTAPASGWKRLPDLVIIGGPQAEEVDYGAYGLIVPTLAGLVHEWSAFSIDGGVTFDELTYLFASLLHTTTPTTSDTTAQTWVFQPSAFSADRAATYTVQVGDDANGGWQASYTVVDGATLTFDRSGVIVAATALAQQWQAGLAPGAGGFAPITAVAEIPRVPCLAGQVAAYLDSTWAGVGGTLLPYDFSAELAITGRWTPQYALGGAVAANTFTGVLEGVPTLVGTTVIAATRASDAFLTQFRAGTTSYLRIAVTSPVLAGATSVYYSLAVDLPVQVHKPDKQAARESVWTAPWELLPVYDPSAGGFLRVTLVNQMQSL